MSPWKQHDVNAPLEEAYRDFKRREAEFNELLYGADGPPRLLFKSDIKSGILREANRRERNGEPVDPGDLYRWQFLMFGWMYEIKKEFWSKKQIGRWLAAGEHRKPLKPQRKPLKQREYRRT